MKRIIAKLNHYNLILRIFENHPEVFEKKPGWKDILAEFEERVQRITAILSDVNRPVQYFYDTRRDAENKLGEKVVNFAGMGISFAVSLNDNAMMQRMKTYRGQVRKVSGFRLYNSAKFVAEDLYKVDASWRGKTMSDQEIDKFVKQAEDFRETLDWLHHQLAMRKALRKELAGLIAQNNIWLHDILDGIYRNAEDDCPDFCNEYRTLRFKKRKRRRRNSETAGNEAAAEAMVTPDGKVINMPKERESGRRRVKN